MATKVVQRSGRVTVGPSDGPRVTIPSAFTIEITDEPPYDLRLVVTWDSELARHTLHELTLTEQRGGTYVRMSEISRISLAEVIERTLVGDVVGPRGWEAIVEDHADADPVAVDALVYRLAYALGGQKPAATIALARGFSPATGPKRAQAARQAGLIPPAEPGKAAG